MLPGIPLTGVVQIRLVCQYVNMFINCVQSVAFDLIMRNVYALIS